MSILTPGLSPLLKGTADGFVVKFANTTQVTITAGIYEVDGTLFNLNADVSHTLTGLTAGALDYHYIYLDKSASTVNIPVFFNETTEAVENLVKNGWYHPTNTEDRLVGVIEKISGVANIQYFDTLITDNKVIRKLSISHTLGLNQSPTGAWQSTTSPLSDFVPVNAVEAAIRVFSANVGSVARVSWRMNEGAAIETNIFNAFPFLQNNEAGFTNAWGPLGASRNIQTAGGVADDNDLDTFVLGYGYTR